jgi:DNA-binding transcriptional ArsR family regulator
LNKVFKALNDATRREILELLRKRDLSAGEIADAFSISKPSISHHLDILKQAELIDDRRDGQFIMYSLNMTVIDEIMEWMIQFKNEKKYRNGKSEKNSK